MFSLFFVVDSGVVNGELVRLELCAVLTSMLTAYLTCTQPKYPKVKVTSTQDKHHISWAAEQSYTAAATDL